MLDLPKKILSSKKKSDEYIKQNKDRVLTQEKVFQNFNDLKISIGTFNTFRDDFCVLQSSNGWEVQFFNSLPLIALNLKKKLAVIFSPIIENISYNLKQYEVIGTALFYFVEANTELKDVLRLAAENNEIRTYNGVDYRTNSNQFSNQLIFNIDGRSINNLLLNPDFPLFLSNELENANKNQQSVFNRITTRRIQFG